MKIYRKLLFSIEILIISAVFFLDYLVLLHWKTFYPLDLVQTKMVVPAPETFSLYVKAFWLAFFDWVIVLWWRSGNAQFRIATGKKIVFRAVINGVIFLGLYTSTAFLFKFEFLSRFFILFYSATATFFLVLNRLAILSIAHRLRKRGYSIRNILVVGTGRRAQHFLSLTAKHPEWGYRVVGLVDPDPMLKGEDVAHYHVIGNLDDLPMILEQKIVDEVYFILPRKWLDEVNRCILYCEAVGVPATISTDLFDLEIATHRVSKRLDDMHYLTFETRLLKGGELLVKRVVDIVLAAIALLIMSPLLLVITVAIKITSKGPVFFNQVRSGLNGRTFRVHKFRTMVMDAEKQLQQLRSKNLMSGPVFKMENDPRITPVGRFLRKTSLDEFPQFWNVLKGEMSVVGPRPPLPTEVEEYEPWQRRRLSMKPGITCIWQVSGRNAIDFERWMELDLKYIDNWSLFLDFKIIFKTVQTVLASNGK